MECLRIKTAGEVRILGYDIDRQQREIRKRIGSSLSPSTPSIT